MILSPNMVSEINRDGPVTIEDIHETPRGTQVIYSRELDRSKFNLPSATEVRSIFFDTEGRSRYNLIIS